MSRLSYSDDAEAICNALDAILEELQGMRADNAKALTVTGELCVSGEPTEAAEPRRDLADLNERLIAWRKQLFADLRAYRNAEATYWELVESDRKRDEWLTDAMHSVAKWKSRDENGGSVFA